MVAVLWLARRHERRRRQRRADTDVRAFEGPSRPDLTGAATSPRTRAPHGLVSPGGERRLGWALLDALGGLPLFVTAPLYRHWHLRWGATDGELAAAMPGDDWSPRRSSCHTGRDNRRPTGTCLALIVQMGYRRAGFYRYALLDNAGYESPERILEEYQQPHVGNWMPMASRVKETTAHRVAAFEVDRWLLWAKPNSTWAWTLDPTPRRRHQARGPAQAALRLAHPAGRAGDPAAHGVRRPAHDAPRPTRHQDTSQRLGHTTSHGW